MSDFGDRLVEEAKRIEEATRSARLSVAVAVHALTPGVAPIAQQAVLTSPEPVVEIRQEIERDQQKDWAEAELSRREQVSRVTASRPDGPTTSRQEPRAKRHPQRTRDR